MQKKSQSGQSKTENISSMIAKEEHFVAAGEVRKDLNAVYIEDNPQKALEKLLNLSKNSNFQEKLQYIKHLAELLDLIGEESIPNLKAIISFVKNDRDEVKRAFMSQTSPLISFLQKNGEKGYKEIVDVILPIVSDFLNAPQYEMKEEAGRQLTKIGKILSEDDKGKHLLTRVLSMGHDDENEENRTIAARLLSQMAPLFGKDLCEQFVGYEFLAMGDDPQFRVRKEAVSNLPSIGKVVSSQFFKQKLLPFYLKECKDNNWGVRQSCVDTIFDISNICKGELANIRENELTEAILNFLKDSNKWVKIGAYKTLGRFISTLQGLKVNEKLIDNYIKMADNSVNNLSSDNEIICACAYNFPAVVLTLGGSRWPILSKLFQTLLKGSDQIKRPLAYSLHDIAKIIGEDKAEKDLFQVLVRFLKDKNDDLKYGVIQNLALFFKVFRIEKREHMIDILLDLQKDQKKWRIRELIAKQIDQLTLIFPPEISFKIIAPISFRLCNDPFAVVREEAAGKIYALLRSLNESEEIYRSSVIENIKGFSISNRFTTRQAFVIMCQNLMKDPELFKENFLECLVPLASDKVPNVRISLAKALQKLHKRKSPLLEDPQIIELFKKLKADPSKDVKSLLKSIEIPGAEAVQELTAENTQATLSTDAQVSTTENNTGDNKVEQKEEEQSIAENKEEDKVEPNVESVLPEEEAKVEDSIEENKTEQKEEKEEETAAEKEEEAATEKEEETTAEKEEEAAAENKEESPVEESNQETQPIVEASATETNIEENNVEQKEEEQNIEQNKEKIEAPEPAQECQPQEDQIQEETSTKIQEQAKQEDTTA